MIKRIERTKRTIPSNLIELQYLYFENRKKEKKSGLGINDPDYEIHSKLINLLYDLNHWHYAHDFKKDEERLLTMTKWFGEFNFKATLEGNRPTHVWVIDINGTTYFMMLTSLGLFLETKVGTNVSTVYKDIKEISKIILQNWKKK